MDAKELRIGNWVVDGKSHVQVENWMFIQEYKNLAPIPLSPSILEKAGFTLDGFKHWGIETSPFADGGQSRLLYFAGDYLYIQESTKGSHKTDDIVTLWNKDIMKIFYLHQLQNLYYSLTGEELTINL